MLWNPGRAGILGEILSGLPTAWGPGQGQWEPHVWMALQISSAEWPALRRVMARFLARLASKRVTLLAAFCAVLFLEQMRSRAGPWAFVLKSSSNLSRSKSWQELMRRENAVALSYKRTAWQQAQHWLSSDSRKAESDGSFQARRCS